MSLVALSRGFLYPYLLTDAPITQTSTALDASGEKLAMIGRVYINGRASSKTIDTTGSSAIAFRLSSSTVWSNGSTSIDIGIQDVATGAGPAAQPDGTFDVYATVAGGAGLTANAWNSVAMTSGTKTIAHGDLVAVVFDMTTRAGSDVFSITTAGGNSNPEPTVNTNLGGAGWSATGPLLTPNVLITFSDGTIATIDFSLPFSVASTEAFQDSTNPDERGNVFQVPFDCKVDALFVCAAMTDAATDFDLKLYSDPLGTPSALATVSLLGEQRGGSTSNRWRGFTLASEVSLTKNTNYCVAVHATPATSNISLTTITVGDAGHLALWPGGTAMMKATRNAGSGAFSTTSTIVYQMGVRISQVHDSAGAGGLLTHPGMVGGIRG